MHLKTLAQNQPTNHKALAQLPDAVETNQATYGRMWFKVGDSYEVGSFWSFADEPMTVWLVTNHARDRYGHFVKVRMRDLREWHRGGPVDAPAWKERWFSA